MIDTLTAALVRNQHKVIIFSLVLFTVLLSIKYFTGFENSDYYSGLTLKFLNPDLFQNDPVFGTLFSNKTSPYTLSAMFVFPSLFGELWLDDRLVVVFYLLSVFATFLAADRIAVLFGVKGITERLIVQMMFLKDHKIVANMVLFAYHSDFNHSAVSYPLALWVLYLALARYRLWAILLVAGILTAVSPQVGPFIIFAALLIVAFTGRETESKIAWLLIFAGFIAAYVVLMHMVDVPENDRVFIWDHLNRTWYKNMANPFNIVRDGLWATVAGNVILVSVFISALACVRFWPGEQTVAVRGAAIIFALSLIMWLTAGLYITYAPDDYKFPQLLLFPYARQLQIPQILVYLVLIAALMRWIRAGGTAAYLSVAGFFVLYLIGPGNYDRWALLFACALAAALVAYTYVYPRTRTPRNGLLSLWANGAKPILFMTFVGVFSVAMSFAAWQKSNDWIFLYKTGVHGASAQAQWVGVSRYFRENTPKDAVILPFSYVPGFEGSQEKHIWPRRNLASRSGRAIAVPFLLAHGFDGDFFRFTDKYRLLGREIGKDWVAGDIRAVTEKINAMKPRVDYIVVPKELHNRIVGPDFTFAKEIDIEGFSILSRRASP